MAKLWMIERDVTGWSDEDVETAGLRAKLCVLWYPNMEWERSFFDREAQRIVCYYVAESETDIRTHARAAGLPCGAVTSVEQVLPGDLAEPKPEALVEPAREGDPPVLRVGDGA